MKFVFNFAAILAFVNFTNAYGQTGITQDIRMMNIDYTLVSANLDQERFSAQNVLISLMNVSDSTLDLRIMNNICPKVPGKFSCMAMPYPMFVGAFKLAAAITDHCGVRHQTSEVLLQNGELAQLEIKDYRQTTCEIVYLADLEITLKLKTDEKSSESTVLVSHKNIIDTPIIKPSLLKLPLTNPLADQQFTSQGQAELNGPFFENRFDIGAEINLNRKDKKVDLAVTHNPCADKPCEAIKGDLIKRTLTIESVKSNKCNEKTYYTNTVSVYDAYPAVVGAVHTYVALEIHDTRFSVCDRGNPSVSALVKVTKRQRLIQDIIVSESTAAFEMSQVSANNNLQ